jgi:transcriptional regulator of nitric oxide reductase
VLYGLKLISIKGRGRTLPNMTDSPYEISEPMTIHQPSIHGNLRRLSAAGKVLGYVFQRLDVVDIPACSGKQINTQVILDTTGMIQDAYVLEHHEPILLVGIPEATSRLQRQVQRRQGQPAGRRRPFQ